MAFLSSCSREFMKHSRRRSTLLNFNHHHYLRSFATSTTPKVAPATPRAPAKPRGKDLGEWVPIMVIWAMVAVAASVGIHTAKQHLMHHPAVKITKKNREMMGEVDNPDAVVSSANKFVNKSFLRKVAHIQERDVLTDSALHNPHTRSRKTENLESAGVAYRGSK